MHDDRHLDWEGCGNVRDDAVEDREFWDAWSSGPQYGTPLYYGPHLERLP